MTDLDLTKLTPSALKKAMYLATELKRVKRQEQYWGFEPTTLPENDQVGFLHSPAKIRAVFGGNRSGKTTIGVFDWLLFMQGLHPRSPNHPVPVFTRYLAPSYEDGIKAIVLKKMREMIPRKWLKGGSFSEAWHATERTLTFKNGSQCRFFSYEQDPNKMGGADLDMVYMDEHAPRNIYDESLARTVDRNGGIVLTMTPEGGITWEYDVIVDTESPDVDHWFFSTHNNPHLRKEGIKHLENLITDPRLKAAKLEGRFVALSGLVYPMFQRRIHAIPPKPLERHWKKQFIIDPHHKKASAMLWRALDEKNGKSYVYREAEFHPHQDGVKALASFIHTKSAPDGPIDQWIGDEAMGGSGINVFGEESVIQSLNEHGVPIVGTNFSSNKSFALGISRMRQALMPNPGTEECEHYIFDTCPETIKQYMRYRYRRETRADEETLREHVVNIHDDFVTCDRYGLMAEPTSLSKKCEAESALDGANW